MQNRFRGVTCCFVALSRIIVTATREISTSRTSCYLHALSLSRLASWKIGDQNWLQFQEKGKQVVPFLCHKFS